MDISRGGAAVEVELDPAVLPNQLLSFGLERVPAADDTVAATIAHIAISRRGTHTVHLAFTRECPEALLKRALFGSRRAERHPLRAALASVMRTLAGRARCRSLTNGTDSQPSFELDGRKVYVYTVTAWNALASQASKPKRSGIGCGRCFTFFIDAGGGSTRWGLTTKA